MINDPLYIASSDHPRMVLTNTPFNGTNFHGWNRNVRMALDAKLKLVLIDGSCPKPGAEHVDLQRWIRMGECTYDVLGKVLLRDSNSKLIQFLMKLNDDYEYEVMVVGKTIGDLEMMARMMEKGFAPVVIKKAIQWISVLRKLGYENEIGTNSGGGVDQRLVAAVCQEMMKTFKGKGAYGVLHQRSIAHTPQQNGRVERKHRNLLDTARALRLHEIEVLTNPQSIPTYPTFKTHDEEMTEHVNPNTPLSAEPNISNATTDNIPSSNLIPVPPTPSVPLRKSSRNLIRPAWLQDFVTPKVPSSNNSTPHYCLFVSSEFKNIPHSHIAFLANVFANYEPTSDAQAEKDVEWARAMKAELAALKKIKLGLFNARLVVRGFNKKEGLDYKHNFSPVAKLATVRVLIAIATSKQWPLHQLDINNAFLHGYIEEEIYMLPPEGYTKASPGQICKLNSLGFIQSKHDYSLFVKLKGEEFNVVLVYVDDMITCNSTVRIQTLKLSLDQKFTIKDFGLAKYFLGIELCKTDTGMHLNQRKYILDLLTDAGLTATKTSSFPLPTQLKVSLDKGTPLNDAGSYRRLVGRLLSLIMTRPDISYVVLHLS
uniref:Reverse transcriptase Ty1/copia-type domain-containing protein n=1 Tax=Tanacetum cinerariifolium TaxID=118510 RepID=A0A6L2JWT9_TANCI|nr:hypothetical protein [Tanacetum cinerariifolium]